MVGVVVMFGVFQWLIHSDYYNYFINMNYFAIGPNFALPVQQPPHNFPPRPQPQTHLVLRIIASALSNSLNNYQNALLASKDTPQPPKQPEQPQIPSKQPSKAAETPTPKLPQMQIPVQKQNKNVPKQKMEAAKGKPQKKAKETQALSTSEEVVPEKQEKPAPSKQEKNRKKSICDNPRPQSLKPSSIPSIDMIETAYLPSQTLNCSQVDKLRETLLLRQVDQWNDKIKCRRDKRQLRLLNG